MNRMRSFWCGTALMLVLGAFAGCGSDSTTPQDEVPALTEDNAVFAAGYLASYISNAYGVYQGALKSAADKAVSVETFTEGGIHGDYTLDFRADDGTTPSPSGSAEWLRAYTAAGQQIEVYSEPYDPDADPAQVPLATCTFDAIAFPYDHTDGAESGTVNGGGTLHAGAYTTTFTVDDLELNVDEYPPSGALSYTAGEHLVVVTFDGSSVAGMTVGENHYHVNLNTGVVTLQP
jgi:hypothetical protein